MKKLIFVFAGLMAFSVINAQSLEEILNKYSIAQKIDLLTNLKTIKITYKMSIMGMETQVERWLKNPNKMKVITNMNGMESITVFDGEKGYFVLKMGDAQKVTEMTPDQANDLRRENIFENYLMNYYNDGLLTLESEEIVNEKPAFKIKAIIKDGFIYTFIDKSSYLMVKQSIHGNQEGIIAESFPSEYAENNGVFLPMKMKGLFMGADAITTVTNVEVDIPMDDIIFKLN
jgi:outer membrane lipoprotein-sorting protein